MNKDTLKKIISKIRIDTNYSGDITFQKKIICKKVVYIIYSEPLTSSDKISDFIIRCLEKINDTYYNCRHLDQVIFNHIDNFKIQSIFTYHDICYYLHYGFTILLVEGSECFFALETKRNLSRAIGIPQTENTLRGAMDCFVEDMQTNIGLIRRRIKDNRLWVTCEEIGRYTKTRINVVYLNGVCKNELVHYIDKLLKKIDIDGIVSSGTIKNLIEKENKCVFPTILSTERPDKVCQYLLDGRIAIMVDCSQFVLILPVVFNDFFLSIEDSFSKSVNITVTRFIRYVAFIITLTAPGIYLAITTHHQEMLSMELLIGFASQRAHVPFPTFVEAFIMLFSFEILRECDLRSPSFATSALSTVGALILGEAAVNAGIVSPIMIIVIAITSLAALIFTEPEMTNGIRWYRFFVMIGGSVMGMVGVVFSSIYIIIKLCSTYSFGIPYFYPFSTFSKVGLRNSIVRFPLKDLDMRDAFFSNNTVRYKDLNHK